LKKVAILQSNYIPWKGYFDMIASVDEFILFDDMQYTRRDWRNRNQIKTPNGLQWLTIPVQVKGKYHQKIKEVEVMGSEWQKLHWSSLMHNYRQAKYFKAVSEWLEPIYFNTSRTNLSEINLIFIRAICNYLSIDTKITSSSDYILSGNKSQRLANICKQSEATIYVSGEAAKEYLDQKVFAKLNINVLWFSYEGYLSYPQLWGDFSERVTILDLLFNCGPNSMKYIK
jgi:hypothetical protein